MIHTYKTKLTARKELHPDIYHLTFSVESSPKLEFVAGQYLILFVPQPDGSNQRRLYSIMSPSTSKETFDIVAEIIPGGVASEYFKKLGIGDSVTFQGPAGLFKLKEDTKPAIFLATGTGLAPMLSMIYELLHVKKSIIPITLFWGLKKREDIYLSDTLKEFSSHFPNFTYYICLSREESLPENEPHLIKGRVNVGFEEKGQGTDINESNYYICGGREVTESLRQYLYEKGAQKENVVFEKF
jgi:ferredoxin-NADP reductase